MPSIHSKSTDSDSSSIAILARILGNGKDFTPTLARYLLGLGFGEKDNARMNDLAARNQQGDLSDQERNELQSYANAGCLLGVLRAKARKVLKKAARK